MDRKKFHNAKAIIKFALERCKDELTPYNPKKPDPSATSITCALFTTVNLTKTRCTKYNHRVDKKSFELVLNLPIKDDLWTGINSFYKKRKSKVKCKLCKDPTKRVDGSTSPWGHCFAEYIFLNMERFDSQGKMNKRVCKYPAVLDLIKFADPYTEEEAEDDK